MGGGEQSLINPALIDFSNFPLDDSIVNEFSFQRRKTPPISTPVQASSTTSSSTSKHKLSSRNSNPNDVEQCQYMPHKKHVLHKRMAKDEDQSTLNNNIKSIQACSSPMQMHSNGNANNAAFTSENMDSMAHLNSTLDLLVAVSCQINETNQLKKEANSLVNKNNDNVVEQQHSIDNEDTHAKSKRTKSLPQAAIDIMMEYFDAHIEKPYPSIEDRRKMSIQGKKKKEFLIVWHEMKMGMTHENERIQRENVLKTHDIA